MSSLEVIGKFDLGYIVKLEDGREGQLRVIEMKGKFLQHHLAGLEEELFGKFVEVEIVFENEHGVLLSQFSTEERDLKEELREQNKCAKEGCELGRIYKVKIIKEMEWGYMFEQVDGYLESAVVSKKIPAEYVITLGNIVHVKVVGFSEKQFPVFSVVTVS